MFLYNWFTSGESPKMSEKIVEKKDYKFNISDYNDIMQRLRVAEDKLDSIVAGRAYTPTPTTTPNPFENIPKQGEAYQLSITEYTDMTNRLKLVEERIEMVLRKNTRSTPTPTSSPNPIEKVRSKTIISRNPFQTELGHELAKRRITHKMGESHGYGKDELAHIIEEYENNKK
jgi:hypothetical protein